MTITYCVIIISESKVTYDKYFTKSGLFTFKLTLSVDNDYSLKVGIPREGIAEVRVSSKAPTTTSPTPTSTTPKTTQKTTQTSPTPKSTTQKTTQKSLTPTSPIPKQTTLSSCDAEINLE